MPVAETYFITWKGRRDGPYSLEQLAALLKNGDIGLLHRVETPSGQMPLRQLLEAAAPGRNAVPVPSSNPASETESPAPSPTATANMGEQEALRLYAICGWCFALPPLTVWAWLRARKLDRQGQAKMAQRLKLLSTGLAIAGVLMWVLIWRIW